MSDTKLSYNVWEAIGNEWEPVLNVKVSEATAETLASLLAYENKVPHDDIRYMVSAHRPVTLSFNPSRAEVDHAAKVLAASFEAGTRTRTRNRVRRRRAEG